MQGGKLGWLPISPANNQSVPRPYRSLALVLRDSGYAGDLASEQGFFEGVNLHTAVANGARGSVVRHDGRARNLHTKLDSLFRSEHPPTALLVANVWPVFAVMIYLLRRGHRVPETVSLIAGDEDHLFETAAPPISHYRFVPNLFIFRFSRLTMELSREGHLAAEVTMMIPTFSKDFTVKRTGG